MREALESGPVVVESCHGPLLGPAGGVDSGGRLLRLGSGERHTRSVQSHLHYDRGAQSVLEV